MKVSESEPTVYLNTYLGNHYIPAGPNCGHYSVRFHVGIRTHETVSYFLKGLLSTSN